MATGLTNAERKQRNAEIVARGGIDNEMLYHEYTDSVHSEQRIATERWELQKEVLKKQFNLPHAPRNAGNMDITNQTQNGMGWKELAVIGAGLLGAGGIGYLALKPAAPPTQPPAAVAPANPGQPADDRDTDTTGEYDIEWAN